MRRKAYPPTLDAFEKPATTTGEWYQLSAFMLNKLLSQTPRIGGGCTRFPRVWAIALWNVLFPCGL